MSKFKHTCKYEQIDEYTFKCSICGKEKMPKELVKDLERQLEEARELVEDAISEIVVSSSDESEYTVLELYERLKQLKEKGE